MGQFALPAEKQDPGPFSVGETFLNYEILELIGRGGHARVYRARHRFMGHPVALKILRADAGINREQFRRGQAEAQIQHQIQHPNIVQVKDAGLTDAGVLYIVMDLLQGRSLRQVIEEHGRLEVEEVLRLALQVAEAMAAAHDKGVIHRDLKPENVFITEGNHVKVIDFGIAKILNDSGFSTQRDLVLGTIYYMSPEQLQAQSLTARSDIYALGVMMYEALAGRHPVLMVLGDRERHFWALSRIIVTEQPPLLDRVDPKIPRRVAALVNQAIAKVATQRFAKMRDFAAAIRECLEHVQQAHGHPKGAFAVRDLSRSTNLGADAESVSSVDAGPTRKDMRLSSGHTELTCGPLFFGTASGVLDAVLEPTRAPTERLPRDGADSEPLAGPTRTERVAAAPEPVRFEAPVAGPAPPRSRKGRWMVLAAGLFGLALVAGAAALISGHSNLPAPAPSAVSRARAAGEFSKGASLAPPMNDPAPGAPLSAEVGLMRKQPELLRKTTGKSDETELPDGARPLAGSSRPSKRRAPSAPRGARSAASSGTVTPSAAPAVSQASLPRAASTARAKPAAPIDKMEERLRRLEEDLVKGRAREEPAPPRNPDERWLRVPESDL